MIGREFEADTVGRYRFGFNWKEGDNETYGEGNEYDYGFRIYNSSLGRFLSVDPLIKSYPELTPYQFASNTPIWAIDFDGCEAKIYQATLNKCWGFILITSLLNSITYQKDFDKTLETQTKYDVYYYTFDSKVTYASGLVADGIGVDNAGFVVGVGGALGHTNVATSKEDLQKQMTTIWNLNFVSIKDLEKSFSEGKSVVLIGIAKQMIDPLNEKKLPLRALLNLTCEIAETVIHEETAHAKNELLGISKSNEEEHKEYHGEATTTSPSYRELLGTAFKNTKAGKSATQIKKVFNAFFYQKFKK